jgi:hypothetical protein
VHQFFGQNGHFQTIHEKVGVTKCNPAEPFQLARHKNGAAQNADGTLRKNSPVCVGESQTAPDSFHKMAFSIDTRKG